MRRRQSSKHIIIQPSRRDILRLLGASAATIGVGALTGCSGSSHTAADARVGDARPPIDGSPANEWDYIVIGAGSAGCPLVDRLLTLTTGTVLLIEAGGSHQRDDIRDFTQAWRLTQPGSDVDWALRSVPQPRLMDRTQSYAAGKVLGGTSSINGMVWARGHRGDYDRWSAAGCTGWDYASVLGSLRRIETTMIGDPAYRGAEGPIHVSHELAEAQLLSHALVDAAVANGHPLNPDYNGASSHGVGFTQLNVRDGVRQDAYTAFVQPHEGSERLTVMTGTLARRLVFDGDRRARGVVVEQAGQEHTLAVRRDIIVCAGTINTAKLLMLSGIGAGDELQPLGIDVVADVPGVGKNLHDHLISVVVKELRQPEPAEHITAMDVSLFAGDMPAELGGAPRWQVQAYYMRYGWASYPSEALALGVINLHPTSRGSVRLDPLQPQGAPIIDPRFLDTTEDLDSQLAGYKMIRALINAPELLEYVVDAEHTPGPDVDTDEELMVAIQQYSEADFHPVGTCKMGVDAGAVVDPSLRVRQITGLRVAGAAVMPYVTSGNTNAPSMMIGDRCGVLVAADA